MAEVQITSLVAGSIPAQDRPQALRLAGVDVTPLVSGGDSSRYELGLVAGCDGHGTPPHSHPWDETYFVIKGEIVIGVGSQEQAFHAGDLVHIPAGERHWFRFDQSGEALDLTSGQQAFAMFQALVGVPEGSSADQYLSVAHAYGEEDRRKG